MAAAEVIPSKGPLVAATCTPVKGDVTPLFFAPSTCTDVVERSVELEFGAPGTLANLECRASTAFVGTLVVIGRTGSCGALADTAFACTLSGSGSGVPSCDSSTNKLQLGGTGQCWSLRLSFPGGPLSLSTQVKCTLVKAL
jgi:hypothetical protein